MSDENDRPMGTIVAQQGMTRFLVVDVDEKEVRGDTDGYLVDTTGGQFVVTGPDPVQDFLGVGFWERYQGSEEEKAGVLSGYAYVRSQGG